MFVLIRNEDEKFVAPAGQEHSYTKDLTKAQIFRTRDSANANKCGNDRIVPLASLLTEPI